MLDAFRICVDLNECLRDLKDNNNLAVAISRQGAFNNPVIAQSDIFCFEEDQNINSYLVAMYIRRDHHNLRKLNEIIERSFESGLFVKWARDSKVALPEATEDRPVISMELDQLYAAMFAYLVFIFFAASSFVAEIFAFRNLTGPNPSRFWAVVKFLIDDERYFLKDIFKNVKSYDKN